MEIQHVSSDSKGYFRAIEDGKEAGRITYSRAGDDKIILDHTEVNDEFRGQNVGKKLVLEAVDYARNHDVKILPLCPYAKSVFDRTAAIQDVL